MDSSHEPRGSIIDWDESDVHTWLSSLGYPQYEHQIREHRISGDVLTLLDADGLKEVGISTIGQRLAILRAVYLAKLAFNVPILKDHYVPPCKSEAEDSQDALTLDRLHEMVKEQGERLRAVEEDNRRLQELLQQSIEELSRGIGRSNDDRTLRKQPSFKWAHYVKPARSPTKSETVVHSDSPHPSPQRLEHDISSRVQVVPPQAPQSSSDRQAVYRTQSSTTISQESSSIMQQQSSNRQPPSRQDSTGMSTSSDNLKSFKVSLEDPAWKVLPAALKKYKINNDDWQNYAMFICYGSTERCLSYDEKPLLLFQKLKDAKKNPVFMLKHIKDIRSPIAVAQQKQAARKASAAALASSSSTAESSSSPSSRPSPAHTRSASLRPPKLQVHGLTPTTGTSPLTTSGSVQPAWPEVMSPGTESKDKDKDEGGSDTKSRLVASMNGAAAAADEGADGSLSAKDGTVTSTGVSYAVAIYPYMAEQEDEFDVVVGDTFIILSRARGWWVVQRDPTGSGVVETDTSKQGWVPAGCLLETNVPVASAVAEATAARAYTYNSGSPPASPASKTPILPLSILSTSFPGVALMDYRKKGDEELDLVKDDLLRVFKRYNHWSYAVKENGGDRGWVPSWFIGKVSGAGGVPPTPITIAPSNGTPSSQVTLDPDFRYASDGGAGPSSGLHSQISPMSSAFPVQSRTATVV